jgi:hypothetical protein
MAVWPMKFLRVPKTFHVLYENRKHIFVVSFNLYLHQPLLGKEHRLNSEGVSPIKSNQIKYHSFLIASKLERRMLSEY